jgi:digeranylgeranylglycerophospholipid reductase
MRDLARADEDTLTRINRGDKLALPKVLHLSDLPLLGRFVRRRLGGVKATPRLRSQND